MEADSADFPNVLWPGLTLYCKKDVIDVDIKICLHIYTEQSISKLFQM